MKRDFFKLYKLDARNLDEITQDKIVDLTLTSPPYFDLKDYGSKKQIGYGQKYDEYLEDLKLVFKKVYNVTKETGTLWVIINTFKKKNEIVPLPFDFANKIKDIGWKLQEIIIWSKDRTVPWTHKGQMRHMFEYVLVFSKTDNFKHYIDRVRDFESLKKWWVKYPERYNPKGKIPEEIWNFDIPTQGSWGNGFIKHFCPLPSELVQRIILLTTDEKDVVLDPFSGSGSVIAEAAFCNRNYIGCELNQDYIRMFNQYIKRHLLKRKQEYRRSLRNRFAQDVFSDLLLKLRVLKYGKVLRSQLIKSGFKKIYNVYAEEIAKPVFTKHKHISAKYVFFVGTDLKMDALNKGIAKIAAERPLSKYGIEPEFKIIKNKNEFLSSLNGSNLFTYKMPNSHKFFAKFSRVAFKRNSSIISPIKVHLNEKDFD